MRFTWDADKAKANLKKHNGISFEIAREVFEDPCHVIIENRLISEEGEQRMQAIGLSGKLVLLPG